VTIVAAVVAADAVAAAADTVEAADAIAATGGSLRKRSFGSFFYWRISQLADTMLRIMFKIRSSVLFYYQNL
jgi:hypothetical protein